MFWLKAGDFLRKNWVYFAIGGALALCLLLAYCLGGADEREDQLQDQIETQKQVGKANDKAGDARVKDAVTREQEKTELKDAIDNATSPDDLRRRRGCAILRQQGRPLPASCG